MGALLYHHWGRLLALTSAIYMVWGAFWGLLYRKFFWDMIGGTLGPHGLIGDSASQVFDKVIVDVPLVQIFVLIMGIFTVALEWPLPFLKGGAMHRSFHFRAVFYLLTGILGILVYQTVDCAIYYVITSGVYVHAIARGELMKEEGTERRDSGEA